MDASASFLEPRTLKVHWTARVSPVHAAVALTALALVVRVVGLTSRPLWLDEAYSWWFSARGWHYLWTVVPTYEPHPPFYYSVLKLWRGIVGSDALALRSLSLVLSGAAIPVVMACAYELERLRPTGRPLLSASIAAFLTASLPMLVVLGQEARPYPVMILAYACAVLAVLRLTREFASEGAGTWKSWLLLASATEVTLWAHGLGLLFAGCLALALFPVWLRGAVPRPRMIRGLAVTSAVAAVYAPCLAMMAGRTGDWGTGWLSWQPIMLLQLIGVYGVPLEALTAASAVAAVVIFLLAKRVLQAAANSCGWSPERALVLLWLGPAVIAATVSALFLPVFLPRTLSPTIIPFCLLAGAVVARGPSAKERKIITAALVITLLPSTFQFATRPAPEPWDVVHAYLTANVKAGDEVWLYPNDSAVPLAAAGDARYKSRGIPGDYPAVGFKGPVRAGSPAVVSLTHEQAQALASDPAHRRLRTIWLLSRQSALFDPEEELPAALSRTRKPGKLQSWGYISVQPFTTRR